MSIALLERGSFAGWLASQGAELSRVRIQSLGRMVGAGLTAAADLQAGEVALRVPKQLWWPTSAEAARERCHARDATAVARVDALAERLGGGRTEVER